MKKDRGFTLIELLVVIAIIGILSSVVLASLNVARGKGADAATKSNLSNARAQAEVYYDGNSQAYTNLCTATGANPGIGTMLTAAQSSSGAASIVTANGTAGTATTVICHADANGWAVSAPLRSETGYWCVDSAGTSAKKTNVLAANSMACPAT